MLILERNIIDLAVPPTGLNETACEGWLSTSTADAEVGDIWLLTVDGAAHAMAVVTKTFDDDDFALVMPVTFGHHASDLEAVFDDSALGLDVTVWFNAETGVSNKRFGRRLVAGAFSAKALRALRRAARDGGGFGLELGQVSREASRVERERIVDLFHVLCLLD